MTPPALPLSAKARRTGDQPISYFMQQAIENPRLISLAAGLVDEESLPAEAVRAALDGLLADPADARAALQYGTTTGLAALRQRVLDRLLAADGVTAAELSLSAADVVLTTGSQQLLYLVGELLLDPGDIVLTEAPSYFVHHGLLTSHGARIVPVPMDDDGLDTDALEVRLRSLERAGDLGRVKLIYVCDYYQNPTGRSLGLERRRRLLELARRYSRQHRILILEDAAYRELRFEGDDLPSVKRYDTANEYVIYTSTFSKPCAPGLKTGYGILPHGLTDPLLRIKGNHDFGSNNLTQHLIDRLLSNGAYDRHLTDLRAAYRRKRDALVRALEREFADVPGASWTRPTGGLYVWLSLPPDLDTGPDGQLIHEALREGVLYVPGQFCHAEEESGPLPRWEARLCFGVATAEEINEAIRRLRRAVASITSPKRQREPSLAPLAPASGARGQEGRGSRWS
jgi:2-aminoadipate transaminase